VICSSASYEVGAPRAGTRRRAIASILVGHAKTHFEPVPRPERDACFDGCRQRDARPQVADGTGLVAGLSGLSGLPRSRAESGPPPVGGGEARPEDPLELLRCLDLQRSRRGQPEGVIEVVLLRR
jgi:hypothetical protein